ncbi:unnamed protein product, partial [Amoebophrya sp. A120]|eukprot:GSA120T00005040001.1
MIPFTTIEKFLRQEGYEHTRTRGSHHQFTHPKRATQPVPVHNHKVRVNVWLLISRNINREHEKLHCEPILLKQPQANSGVVVDAGSCAGGGAASLLRRPITTGKLNALTISTFTSSSERSFKAWKPQPEAELATDEREEYERLLLEYEKRAQARQDKLVSEILEVEAQYHNFVADRDPKSALDLLERVLFKE